MDNEKLKQCPFCGGESHIDKMGTNRQSMIISCSDCGCILESSETCISEHSNWNTRCSEALEQEVEQLRKGLLAVRNLINESEGVAGLHLNGEMAPWGSLELGGDFEGWLIDFNAAEELAYN